MAAGGDGWRRSCSSANADVKAAHSMQGHGGAAQPLVIAQRLPAALDHLGLQLLDPRVIRNEDDLNITLPKGM